MKVTAGHGLLLYVCDMYNVYCMSVICMLIVNTFVYFLSNFSLRLSILNKQVLWLFVLCFKVKRLKLKKHFGFMSEVM